MDSHTTGLRGGRWGASTLYAPTLILVGSLLTPLAPAHAVDAPTANVSTSTALMAASCANCHGGDARGSGAIPGLAGKPASVLLHKMQDMQSGKETHATIMPRLIKGYSPEQLSALARLFEGMRP